MVKIIDHGLVPPDDPMFSGTFRTFSHRKSKPSTKNTSSSVPHGSKKQSEAPPTKPKRKGYR